MITSTILFGLLFLCSSIQGQDKELIAGHVLYRHGDRTPITTFPTDPMKPSDWPNGFGQLTATGVEQHHRLGQFIRERYKTLLNTTYVASEIVIRSTDFDRTLMSAQSNLIGLYPRLDNDTDKVPVQPIPIHTAPAHDDYLLGQNYCPRYDQVEEEVNQGKEMQEMNAYYADFFRQLQNWTGLSNITVYNAWDIADTIFVETIYGKAPQWASPAVRANLSNINDLAFHFLFGNDDAKRIRGGPCVQDIWMNMNKAVQKTPFPKVKMYSAHDTTVSAVLAFLRINYPHQPQYASALFVDLWKINSTYVVLVEYKNVTDSATVFSYQLKGCPSEYCPLDTFTNIYKPLFPDTADKECANKTPPMPPMPDKDPKGLIAILIVAIVSLILIVGGLFWCIRRRNSDDGGPLLTRGGDNVNI